MGSTPTTFFPTPRYVRPTTVRISPEPAPADAPILAQPASALALFLSGLKAGLLTFGGAYTAIPFLREDAVERGTFPHVHHRNSPEAVVAWVNTHSRMLVISDEERAAIKVDAAYVRARLAVQFFSV